MKVDELDIRSSPLAGRWYPGDPATLSRDVDTMLREATVPLDLRPATLGLIAPHAGLPYSGPVAAHAFSLLIDRPIDTVILVGPSHYPVPYDLFTTAHNAWETPLGRVPVDQVLIERLRHLLEADSGRRLPSVRQDREHSLEMELPFLQRVLPSFKIVPVVMLDQSIEAARAIGKALAKTVEDRRAILVASSDLSHFYPQSEAQRLDQEMLQRIEAYEPERVIEAEEEGIGYACGRGAIAAIMIAAGELGATQARILKQADSGEITGDSTSVVGYAAGVLWNGN